MRWRANLRCPSSQSLTSGCLARERQGLSGRQWRQDGGGHQLALFGHDGRPFRRNCKRESGEEKNKKKLSQVKDVRVAIHTYTSSNSLAHFIVNGQEEKRRGGEEEKEQGDALTSSVTSGSIFPPLYPPVILARPCCNDEAGH